MSGTNTPKTAAIGDTSPEVGREKSSPDFPEGGSRAWLVVLGAWCVSFSTFGYMNAYGVYQDYYSRTFLSNESSSSISWIGSVQVFFLFFGSVAGGPLFDRYGSRIIHVPAIAVVVSVMMTSLCKKYYQFMLAQGILGGMASGMIFAPAMTCVSHYFHEKRAVSLGVTVSGSSLGGVLFPIALSRMLRNGSLGFGWSVRIIGFIILFMMIIAMITIKERLPPRQGKVFLPSAFTHGPYVLVTMGIAFMVWGLFTPFFYLPSFADTLGMEDQLSSYLLSILNAASVFGRILPGMLADKFGRYNVLIITSSCTGILLFCWVTPVPNQIGTYLGMSMAIVAIAGLTGTPICGALLQKYGSYTQAAIFGGVVVLFGTFLVGMAKLQLHKNPLAKV